MPTEMFAVVTIDAGDKVAMLGERALCPLFALMATDPTATLTVETPFSLFSITGAEAIAGHYADGWSVVGSAGDNRRWQANTAIYQGSIIEVTCDNADILGRVKLLLQSGVGSTSWYPTYRISVAPEGVPVRRV